MLLYYSIKSHTNHTMEKKTVRQEFLKTFFSFFYKLKDLKDKNYTKVLLVDAELHIILGTT